MAGFFRSIVEEGAGHRIKPDARSGGRREFLGIYGGMLDILLLHSLNTLESRDLVDAEFMFVQSCAPEYPEEGGLQERKKMAISSLRKYVLRCVSEAKSRACISFLKEMHSILHFLELVTENRDLPLFVLLREWLNKNYKPKGAEGQAREVVDLMRGNFGRASDEDGMFICAILDYYVLNLDESYLPLLEKIGAAEELQTVVGRARAKARKSLLAEWKARNFQQMTALERRAFDGERLPSGSSTQWDQLCSDLLYSARTCEGAFIKTGDTVPYIGRRDPDVFLKILEEDYQAALHSVDPCIRGILSALLPVHSPPPDSLFYDLGLCARDERWDVSLKCFLFCRKREELCSQVFRRADLDAEKMQCIRGIASIEEVAGYMFRFFKQSGKYKEILFMISRCALPSFMVRGSLIEIADFIVEGNVGSNAAGAGQGASSEVLEVIEILADLRLGRDTGINRIAKLLHEKYLDEVRLEVMKYLSVKASSFEMHTLYKLLSVLTEGLGRGSKEAPLFNEYMKEVLFGLGSRLS